MTNDNIIFEEKITTDDFGMPLRYYYVNSSDEKDLVMFAHWHNEIEIQIFLNGSAAITIDNKEFNVEKMTLCLFLPNQFTLAVLNQYPLRYTILYSIQKLCVH